MAIGESHRRRSRGLGGVVAVVLLALGALGDRTCANFLSFNPRAQSSEGKVAARCLSTTEGRSCQWDGWKRWGELKDQCPQVRCMSSVILGRAYALKRHGADSADVVAVGVDVFRAMRGDAWLGVYGDPVHCVDTTAMPSPLEGLLRGHDRETYTVRSSDGRCASLLTLLERGTPLPASPP